MNMLDFFPFQPDPYSKCKIVAQAVEDVSLLNVGSLHHNNKSKMNIFIALGNAILQISCFLCCCS